MGIIMIDISFVRESFPYLIRGSLLSLQIAGIACGMGLFLGTILAIIQTGTNKILKTLVTAYVTLIRGTPMLVQIMIIFFLLPQIGLNLPDFWAATLAIGLNSSAYLSQVFRTGITSIAQGQWEAAQVLGFNKTQTLWYIILPQALRVVLPTLGNEFITLIKDSSLASSIGVKELMKEGQIITSNTYRYLDVFLMVALIYLVLTSLLSLGLSWLEKRMKHAQH